MQKIVFNWITVALFAATFSACAIYRANGEAGSPPESFTLEFRGNPQKKKSIFVFLDGTANDTASGTNVWRLYRLIHNAADPQVAAKYIQGVGTVENTEFHSSWFFGLVFGQGMERRIKTGYDFLVKNYAPGDDIFIFGFSRGAHEARSLAGFLAYVGIPVRTAATEGFGHREWNQILEITKKKRDVDYASFWGGWVPGTPPPLADEAGRKLGEKFQPIQVTMLGVWDTVPGSSFKKFGTCKELPDGKGGDRYKLDSYPPIRLIAHAVAIDEKRNKYRPILLCPAVHPLDESLKPKLIEKWFPGAHADVGGGYSDGDNALANISFNWMVDILAQNYVFPSPPSKLPEDANGLAHWSVGDMKKIPGMRCEDRPVPTEEAKHESAKLRKGRPPIRVKGRVINFAYPISCADEKRLYQMPQGNSD
ncbi:MAG: DUF2235 domain-containing protein [Desulfobacteraceae bacterium]|jgi:hypothetical protein|nr:DUF2235 domain-containing protein [Desulfobacteraceae bacterium]